jgi:ribonuclease BN (tRNA processing enzyme)
VPHHLQYADLAGRAREITARRVVLTHMSADMLARQQQAIHQIARDGLAITV